MNYTHKISNQYRAENQVFEGIRKYISAHQTGTFVPEYYGIVPKITAPAWSWR